MGMANHGLGDLLKEVRRELDLAHELEEEVRAEFHEVLEEFETEFTEGDHVWVRARERLAERAIEAQAAHPTLTAAADRLIRQLSRMGI